MKPIADQIILGRLYYYYYIGYNNLKQSVYCLRMNYYSLLKYSQNVNKLRFLNKELNSCAKCLLFLDLYTFFCTFAPFDFC